MGRDAGRGATLLYEHLGGGSGKIRGDWQLSSLCLVCVRWLGAITPLRLYKKRQIKNVHSMCPRVLVVLINRSDPFYDSAVEDKWDFV